MRRSPTAVLALLHAEAINGLFVGDLDAAERRV